MPFSSTASVTSTDMNNMLRGLYRDNADHALTGTVAETDLASVSVSANTIGSTGAILVEAAGTRAGGANTRTVRFYFGSTSITIVGNANVENWYFRALITNTSTSTQRIQSIATNASTFLNAYTAASIDTTANVTVKLTGQLTNTGDTITQTMFNVFVVQIT